MRKIRLRVREIAESQGMTEETLAGRTGMPADRVRQIWDDPFTNLTTEELARIAEALDVKTHELIEDVEA